MIDYQSTFPILSISTNPDNLYDPYKGIYVRGANSYMDTVNNRWANANFLKKWERKSKIIYIDTNGVEVINQNAGLRIFGGMTRFRNEKSLRIIARDIYGEKRFSFPFFKYRDNNLERDRLIDKLNTYFVKSIWLQFGSEINQLSGEVNFLNNLKENFHKFTRDEINIYGSLFIPSKQFIARFKFRPWRGVYLSNKYLNSLEEAGQITKQIVSLYLNNSIIPLIETELSTEKQFIEAQNFIDL